MSVDSSTTALKASADLSRAKIADSIRDAASATGTSFEYLLATAKMESNFDPAAKATTSSARGLYQFIDQTWLSTVKQAGGTLGYPDYANAITQSSSGAYSVDDPAKRKAILKLRDDPAVSSAMAGVLTHSNSFKLTAEIGRRPTDAELYMAHFMGVGGAAKLIGNAETNPQASGARLFPNAASANRSIFYDQSGRARSVSEVYAGLARRYSAAANSADTRSAMAAAGVTTTNIPQPAKSATFLASFPDVHSSSTSNASAVPAVQTASVRPPEPIFRSLFQAGERSQAVSSAVHELWGSNTSLPSAAPSKDAKDAARPFDLFSDRFGAFSS